MSMKLIDNRMIKRFKDVNIFSRALLKALAIGTLIACLTINSSKQKNQQHSETSAIQNSFSSIRYFKESSSIFDFWN